MVNVLTNRAAQANASTIPATKPERLRLLREYRDRTGRGLLQIISRRTRSDSGQVSRVFHGFSTSGRIRRAIERELARVFGQAEPNMPGQGSAPEAPIVDHDAGAGNGRKGSRL